MAHGRAGVAGLSNPDSFIDEVTEEVRRDRLFAMFRKYGWIGVLAVVAIVGGAAYTEWSKARSEARAQAFGDAVLDAVDPNVVMRVDANCGWTESDARIMIPWLAERRVEYVEQPLACGDEESLAALRPAPVPIFLDESIHSATDVPKFAHLVDGVNVKLMKSGGISEAIRIVHTARAFGLQTMLGCMSESSLSIAAGVHIGPLFDHLDLDSHLNTADDPIVGLGFEHGRVTQSERPGLGVDVPEGV